jgi:transposase
MFVRPVDQVGFGSGPACWRRLRDWKDAGVRDRLHDLLLAKLREAGQLDFSRSAVNSSSVRAVGAGEKLARTTWIARDPNFDIAFLGTSVQKRIFVAA